MLLPITLTFAAACALLNMWLAIRCARFRVKDKILHGDAGNGLLAKRMRAHANFVEYTPIVLILFALVEMAAGASLGLWIGALVYVVARVVHAFGMDADKPTIWRAGGALLTWGVMLVMAGVALSIAYGATREVTVPPAMAAREEQQDAMRSAFHGAGRGPDRIMELDPGLRRGTFTSLLVLIRASYPASTESAT